MPHSNPDTSNVGGSWTIWMTVVCTVAAVLLLVSGGLWLATKGAPAQRIVIASGPEGGTYHEVGERLDTLLEKRPPVADTVRSFSSEGSAENARRIKEAVAHLAIVQADTDMPANARLIAPLYDETLHVLAVGDAPTVDIESLEGKRVFLGQPESGTRRIASRVFEFHGVSIIDVHEIDDVAMTSGDAMAALLEPDGPLDAIVVLGAYPEPRVESLIERGASMITLGDAKDALNPVHALIRRYPVYRADALPARAYGTSPAVQTLSVPALLIAPNDGLSGRAVEKITKRIFEQRKLLRGRTEQFERELPAMSGFRERFDPSAHPVPYHRGAEAHYTRNAPWFVAPYAEPLSLLLALLGVAFSTLVLTYQKLEQRKKNRIDAYYLRVESFADKIEQADAGQLEDIRMGLDKVRAEAFRDLVDERVEANEAFIIFQNFVRGEIDALEYRLRRLARYPEHVDDD
ncbi:MAG: TAXI family TRAP transporter solute-binding subunit [Planctomycetota bacterium]